MLTMLDLPLLLDLDGSGSALAPAGFHSRIFSRVADPALSSWLFPMWTGLPISAGRPWVSCAAVSKCTRLMPGSGSPWGSAGPGWAWTGS